MCNKTLEGFLLEQNKSKKVRTVLLLMLIVLTVLIATAAVLFVNMSTSDKKEKETTSEQSLKESPFTESLTAFLRGSYGYDCVVNLSGTKAQSFLGKFEGLLNDDKGYNIYAEIRRDYAILYLLEAKLGNITLDNIDKKALEEAASNDTGVIKLIICESGTYLCSTKAAIYSYGNIDKSKINNIYSSFIKLNPQKFVLIYQGMTGTNIMASLVRYFQGLSATNDVVIGKTPDKLPALLATNYTVNSGTIFDFLIPNFDSLSVAISKATDDTIIGQREFSIHAANDDVDIVLCAREHMQYEKFDIDVTECFYTLEEFNTLLSNIN